MPTCKICEEGVDEQEFHPRLGHCRRCEKVRQIEEALDQAQLPPDPLRYLIANALSDHERFQETVNRCLRGQSNFYTLRRRFSALERSINALHDHPEFIKRQLQETGTKITKSIQNDNPTEYHLPQFGLSADSAEDTIQRILRAMERLDDSPTLS